MTAPGPRPALDATMRGVAIGDSGRWAARAEELGFDGVFVTETNNDPFMPLALASERTERVTLGTGIALAFPRTPMEVAYTGWDLQDLSGGRFVLGLGTQVRAHVERRFGADLVPPGRAACASTCWPCARSGTRGRPASRSTSGASSARTR